MKQASTTVPIALLLLLRKTNAELCWIVLEKHQLSAGSEHLQRVKIGKLRVKLKITKV